MEATAAGPHRGRWPWIVGGLVLLAIGFRAALPAVLARGIEAGALRFAAIPVEVGDVDLGLLAGSIAVEEIRVGRSEAGPLDAPWFRLGRLAAKLSWLDLIASRVHLRELALEGPVVRLARLADGSLELPILLAPEAGPEPPPEADGGWPLALDVLRVAGIDFELSEAGRNAPSVRFTLEELSLTDLAIAGGDVTLGGVDFRSPRLRIERSLVLGPRPAPAAPGLPADPAAAPAPSGAGAPRYRLEKIDLQAAGISLLTETRPLDLELDLSAEGVSARPGESFPLRVAVRVEGGEVHVEGRAGLAPLSFEGAVRWRNLPLPLFVLVARPELAPWVRSCNADGDLRVAVRLQPGMAVEDAARVQLAGELAVRDLSLADPGDHEVAISWRALEVGIHDALVPLGAEAQPIRLALGAIRLDEPLIRYVRPAPALDTLLGLTPPAESTENGAKPAEAAPPPEPAAAGAVELSVESIEIARGTLGYADTTLDPRYEAVIRDLAVAAHDVRWPAIRARRIRVRGVAPERAPFTLRGDLDGATGELQLELQRLLLPPLDSFAASAGYRFARGEVSLRSLLRLEPTRYVVQNDLLLHDLRLDSADPGRFEHQFGTSLDFALALLRDRAGDIRLPVPVSIERESLRLGLGQIVIGALRAALVGMVSSPLKALGAALPRGGEGDIEVAAFASEPGAAEPAEGPRVEALVAMLSSRPLLAISLAGRAGEADVPVLAERSAIERAVAGESQAEVEGVGWLAQRRVAAALRARAAGEPEELGAEDAELLARVVAATPVPAERLRALAAERAARLRAILVDERGIEAARVAVDEPASDGAPGVALTLGARVETVVGAEQEAPAAAP